MQGCGEDLQQRRVEKQGDGWKVLMSREVQFIHLLCFQIGEAIAELYVDKNEGGWIDIEVVSMNR